MTRTLTRSRLGVETVRERKHGHERRPGLALWLRALGLGRALGLRALGLGRRLALGLGLAVSLALPAFAQHEVRVELDLFVPPLQRLEIVSPILVMPELTAADVAMTHVDLPRPLAVRVSSNTPWELCVRNAEGSIVGRDELGAELFCAVPNAPFQPLGDEWLHVAEGPPGEEIALDLFLRTTLKQGLLMAGHHEVRLDYRLSVAGH